MEASVTIVCGHLCLIPLDYGSGQIATAILRAADESSDHLQLRFKEKWCSKLKQIQNDHGNCWFSYKTFHPRILSSCNHFNYTGVSVYIVL